MMREYGGYLPLELREGNELFDRYGNAKIARFNSGRGAIAAAVKEIQLRKLYIPYYNCAVVRETLTAYRISYEQYYLDDNLEPEIDSIGASDWILYVNYFGIASGKKIEGIAQKYKNVIFDNTQAFYAPPIIDGNCMNVYSPRKFIGLVDGGYLIWSGERNVSEDYPLDISWERAGFLFKSIELGTNAAYKENLESKICLADGIKRMSVLTRKMLRSVDYDYLSKVRDRNYRVLIDKFKEQNQLKIPMDGFAPFTYPLVIESQELRRKMIEKKIYVPQWWKYLLDKVPGDSIEAWLSKWLLPLPVDHRYTKQDMEKMADIILELIG